MPPDGAGQTSRRELELFAVGHDQPLENKQHRRDGEADEEHSGGAWRSRSIPQPPQHEEHGGQQDPEPKRGFKQDFGHHQQS